MVKAENKLNYSTRKLSAFFRVSRSRIYRRKTTNPCEARIKNELRDLRIIESLFLERKCRIGIQQIKMLIHSRFGQVMNTKKIARIKNKYGLITQIRQKKNYRKFIKLQQEHRTTPNHLNRKFARLKPDEVYSTDITQINYGEGQKAYLSVFKDLGTKEVISSQISKRMDIKLVSDALNAAINRLSRLKRKKLMIHSDQGFHFTHFSYRNQLKENGIKQSMSRKGNCIDNAPIESFFGHIKDHLGAKACKSFKELEDKVTKEIQYYNYKRPQWHLKKMPPIKYRRHLNFAQGFY